MNGPFFRMPGSEDSITVALLAENDFLWVLGGKAVNCKGENWLNRSYTRLRKD